MDRNRGNNWNGSSRGNGNSRNNNGFRGRKGGQDRQNYGNARGVRKFKKIADVDSREKKQGSEYWAKPWTSNNNNHNYNNQRNFGKNGKFGGTSHLYNNTDGGGFSHADQNSEQYGYAEDEQQQQQMYTGNAENIEGISNEQYVEQSISTVWSSEKQTSARKDSFTTNVSSTPLTEPEPTTNTVAVVEKLPQKLINIKQEKPEILKLKTERKSSSSSSSSDSSSSEEETDKPKGGGASTTATSGKLTSSSPLTIKLKPLAAINKQSTVSPSVNITKNIAPPPSSSSSSSSSSEDEEAEEEPPTLPPINSSKDKIKQSKKKKNRSEDDVVCMGNLENKIVLEDDDEDDEKQTEDSDENRSIKSKKKSKKHKKSLEKCMICDKKGHTSFQCQMICRNCSAPYHGFRTCPQPANLNTMLQLYMEFCMQQLQHYQPDRQFQHLLHDTNARQNVPQPLVGSPSTSRPGKRKKQLKSKESSKASMVKKRKQSAKKKQNNDDDSDNTSPDSDEETSDSDDDSSSSEGFESLKTNKHKKSKPSSSEGFESLTTSKHKKSKAKQKTNSTMPVSAFNMENFMPNNNHAINYPLTLNGLTSMTGPPANPQLNSLLLTQMFQNVIGSLNSKRSS